MVPGDLQGVAGELMGQHFAAVVADGPLVAALVAAALAGLASVLSPCILPLVPAYLSYATGLTGADLSSGRRRNRVLAGSALFVAGFATVFISASVLAAKVALTLGHHTRLVQAVAGVLIVALGLALLGWIPGLQRHWGMRHLPTAGLAGAPVIGAVFALSWTPCVGPTLGAVLTLAAVQGSMTRAVLLAVAYCVGLGVPFVAIGLGLGRLLGAITWVRRHGAWVTRLGGALLVVIGLSLTSGLWTAFVRWLLTTVGVGTALL